MTHGLKDIHATTFGEVNILLGVLNGEIEALKSRVAQLEPQATPPAPLLEPDGRPLGWELTEEAQRAHDDEQAVGGSAPAGG